MIALKCTGLFLALIEPDFFFFWEPLGTLWPCNLHGNKLSWSPAEPWCLKSRSEGKWMEINACFDAPKLPFPESRSLLLPNDDGTELRSNRLLFCVTCPACGFPLSPAPRLCWIICDWVSGAHGHPLPPAVRGQCQSRVPKERKETRGKTLQRSPVRHRLQPLEISPNMGGPVWGCLLLIELLTQPLALEGHLYVTSYD